MDNPAALARVDPGDRRAALVAAHPWPEAWARARRLDWLWTIDVDAPVAALWPLVSDVSRLNRALGNPELHFEERDGERWGRGRYAGLLHEWREVPWQWVAEQWFSFSRLYTRGGMRALHAIHQLTPLDRARTRVEVYFGVVPRSRLFDLGLRWSFAALGRAYRRVLPTLARPPRPGLATPLVAPGAPRPGAEARLAAIAADLATRPIAPTLVARLIELIERGDDLDVCRLQVRALARRWEVEEDALLSACLHATRAGLLELVWDVVCPHCRGVRTSETALDRVPTEGGCAVCDVRFGTAEAVEVSFRAHPSLRSIALRTYCSAEPATKTHVRVQRALSPGQAAAVGVALAPGRYRLRAGGATPVAGFLEVRLERGAATVGWDATAGPGEVAIGPRAELALRNDAGEPRTFIVEQAGATELALRPGRLFSFQEFRDLFSEAFLGAEVQLSVGEQTILFTDVVGSTALYATRGDPAAFVTVRDHFRVLFELIARHRGAVVKTIGDSAMGAFTDPLDAVRAADAIQARFGPGAPVRLRAAINTGPCIAVRLNANLDYFGNAVNLAARLQSLVGAGEVAIAAATAEAPGVAAYLADRATVDATVTLAGLAGPVATRRWRIGPA